MTSRYRVFAAITLSLVFAVPAGAGRTLTMADRIAAQRAIEEVYWRHRIWPKDNPGPKPPLSAVMSDAAIRRKVEDRLAASKNLTAEQLRAEVERMKTQTRNPGLLAELFAALRNDPFVIAECLARPVLAERLAGTRIEEAFSALAPAASACIQNTWWPTGIGAAATVRGGHATAWTGTEMVVWGGVSSGSSVLNTGARYDPATDTWTATSASVLAARRDALAVWTGTRVLIWGGANFNLPSPYYGDGAAYDPAANTWTVMSSVNAPSARVRHSVVWTGAKMIVWGGSNGSMLATGGLYDPAADSWQATSTVGAPFARDLHGAVWTGSLMVVWSGYDSGGNSPPTGGRYDPATDTWTATSLTGNPGGRAEGSAVWTGSKMIVWGGWIFAGHQLNYTASGGVYDPIADVWTGFTGSSGLSGRAGHVAVWTDSRMLIWGGSNVGGTGGSALGDGALFDPASSTWTPAPTSLAPSPRSGASGVWTGSEVIVWGGSTDSGPTNTGARYCGSSACPSAARFYRDVDTDGFGVTAQSTVTCDGTAPAGYVANSSDCNDASVTTYPGAPQLCNGINDDCSSPTWPTVPASEANFDGDAYRGCDGDCADANPNIYPGAPQICDGFNDNCSDPTWPTPPANEANADGDSQRICAGDCNDADSSVYAGAPQLCDGKNNNCSDPSWPTVPANEADADGDGYRVCQNDCNDGNANVRPNAAEVCNTIDDNCNAQIDEDALGVDTDSDGVHNACDNCRTVANSTQTDSDGDHVGNVCDNCVTTSNASQTDSDGDTLGNACDNCPTAPNVAQTDTDADRAGDACDNCLFEFNATQADFNQDGEGDICDFNDGLIYVFGTDDKNYIEWQGETGPSAWNVYEGDLSILRSSGIYTQAPGSNPLADRQCGVADVFVQDLVLPAAGQVRFSLVTGVTGGVEGSLGTNSAGAPRANTNPCP